MVKWTKIEKKIIDDPLFQRLRRVKQLGLATLVFPGAEHTRFSHCIGTMEIAGKVCAHLQEKMNKINSEFVLQTSEVQLIRLAALLHDIGHLPLSHVLERVYNRIEDKETPERSGVEELKGKKDDSEIEDGIKGHEGISAYIAEKILSQSHIQPLLEPYRISPRDVGKLIKGSKSSIFLLSQMIHSDLDFDQMDYMLRDGKNTGTIYSNFDLEYLIDSLEIVRQTEGQTIRRLLCVDISGLRAAEHYVLASYYYYSQILFHKTRVIIETIAEKLYRLLLEMKKFNLPSNYSEIKDWIDSGKFVYFDDLMVLEVFKKATKESKSHPCTRELAECILNRGPFPKVVKEIVQFGKFKKGKELWVFQEATKDCFPCYTRNERALKLESSSSPENEDNQELKEERKEPPIYIVYDPDKCIIQDIPKVIKIENGKRRVLPLSDFNNTLTSQLRDHTLLIERIYELK